MTELLLEALGVTETDRAYLAALVDSSASVKVKRENRKNRIRRDIVLKFSRLSDDQADWLIRSWKGGRKIREKCSLHGVTFTTNFAAKVLVEAHAYLRKKREHAKLVFEFLKTLSRKGRDLSEDQERQRAEIDRRLQALRGK